MEVDVEVDVVVVVVAVVLVVVAAPVVVVVVAAAGQMAVTWAHAVDRDQLVDALVVDQRLDARLITVTRAAPSGG